MNNRCFYHYNIYLFPNWRHNPFSSFQVSFYYGVCWGKTVSMPIQMSENYTWCVCAHAHRNREKWNELTNMGKCLHHYTQLTTDRAARTYDRVLHEKCGQESSQRTASAGKPIKWINTLSSLEPGFSLPEKGVTDLKWGKLEWTLVFVWDWIYLWIYGDE